MEKFTGSQNIPTAAQVMEDLAEIIPAEDVIICYPKFLESPTGILLSTAPNTTESTVVAVGPGRWGIDIMFGGLEMGGQAGLAPKRIPMFVEVGDHVIHRDFTQKKTMIRNHEVLTLRPVDIIAVVRKPEEKLLKDAYGKV